MKFKSVVAAAASAVLLGTALPAAAVSDLSDPLMLTGSFADRVLDTFVIGSMSNVEGEITWATGSVNFTIGSLVFNQALEDGSISSMSLGPYLDLDGSELGFRFENVGAGTYQLLVSGSTDGLSIMQSSTDITPVPEPESMAMLLAGLGVLGFVMRRRLE